MTFEVLTAVLMEVKFVVLNSDAYKGTVVTSEVLIAVLMKVV